MPNQMKAIRRSVTIDWTQKETVRANMRHKVKHLLAATATHRTSAPKPSSP